MISRLLLFFLCAMEDGWRTGTVGSLPVSKKTGGSEMSQPAMTAHPADSELLASLAKLWPHREHESNAIKNIFALSACITGTNWI
jgi:hypothetical protein